jgi:hypothetical protein
VDSTYTISQSVRVQGLERSREVQVPGRVQSVVPNNPDPQETVQDHANTIFVVLRTRRDTSDKREGLRSCQLGTVVMVITCVIVDGWLGLDHVCLISDLFTCEKYRKQGLASTAVRDL